MRHLLNDDLTLFPIRRLIVQSSLKIEITEYSPGKIKIYHRAIYYILHNCLFQLNN